VECHLKSRLIAALVMTAVFAGCAGGSTSIPSAGGSLANASPTNASSTVQKPVFKPATTGLSVASNIYVDDAGTMKVLPVSSSGAASYTAMSMPSSFTANGGGGGQFAAMSIGGNNYIAYVNSVPPAPNVQPALTVCQVVVERVILGHKIEIKDVCNAVSVIGGSPLANPNGGVEVVWDNADSTLATLNKSNNQIAMFSYTGGDTLAMVGNTTFSKATGGYIAMAADPLTGGLWVITAASYSPYLMGYNSATASFGSPVLESNITPQGPPASPTALDVNNNYDMWVGNVYGSVYNNDNGTEQLYAPGTYCSQLSNVTAIGSDTQNGYIAGSNMVEVYPDTETEGGGCPTPARTITGFSNIEGLTIL
jgi:hypothetical protein